MVWLILILAALMRIPALNQSFWLDEAAQAVLSSKPIFSVHYASDFQPPLFYIFSHFWMQLGAQLGTRAEWFLRLPSVFFSIACIFLLFKFVEKIFSRRTAIIASLFLAVSPFNIYYAQEFRMYSFLTLVILCSWIFLWHKKWLLYALSILIGVFTHYFAFIAILSHVIFVITTRRKDFRHFILVLGAGLSPFVLWVPVLIQQVRTSQQLIHAWPGWSALSNVGFFKFPGLVLAKFTVGMISPQHKLLYAAVVAGFGIIVLIAVAGFVKKRLYKKPEGILVICAVIFPLLISWIGGIFISASSPWRIQFILPFFYVGLAVGLTQFKTTHIKRYLAVGGFAFVMLTHLFFSSTYVFEQKYHREDWRSAISYSDSLIQNDDLVLTEYIGPWAPMEWYSAKFGNYRGSSSTPAISEQSVENGIGPLIQSDQRPFTIVLYTYLFELSDPQNVVSAYLSSHGYILSSEKDFRGVGIIKEFQLHQ